jgi:hypothetical protein
MNSAPKLGEVVLALAGTKPDRPVVVVRIIDAEFVFGMYGNRSQLRDDDVKVEVKSVHGRSIGLDVDRWFTRYGERLRIADLTATGRMASPWLLAELLALIGIGPPSSNRLS